MREMIRGFLLIFLIAGTFGPVAAQDQSSSITEAELRDHMFFLASDALGGRDTGSPGYAIAADYAATQFHGAGVLPGGVGIDGAPTFFQPVDLSRFSLGSETRLALRHGGMESVLDVGGDYFIQTNAWGSKEEVSGPLVFAGYGMQAIDQGWNDLEGLDLAGSIPIVLFGQPGEDLTSAFAGESVGNPWLHFQRKIQLLEGQGATAVVAVLEPANYEMWTSYVGYFSGSRLGPAGSGGASRFPEANIPVVFLSSATLGTLFAGTGFDPTKLEGSYATYPLEDAWMEGMIQGLQESVSSPNVIGLVEGTDPVLKNEYLVVGAHLDHVGMGGGDVRNGADDNASGSIGVMEIAEAVAMAPLKRSVLFVLYTGEEKGLLGARHFVGHSPVPLDRIVANVNIEMIGRWSHRPLGSGGLFSIIGSDEDGVLRGSLSEVNQGGFDYELDVPEEFIGGSDHMAFQAEDIPNITIAGSPPSGTHEDYHGPGDEAEKIEFAAMRKAAALIYALTVELANRGG
jgi:hypothetical protein